MSFLNVGCNANDYLQMDVNFYLGLVFGLLFAMLFLGAIGFVFIMGRGGRLPGSCFRGRRRHVFWSFVLSK